MKTFKNILYIFILMISLCLFSSCTKKELEVKLLDENGEIVNTLTISKGEELELPLLTKEGYTFVGWTLNDILMEKIITINSDMTLKASFKINSYTYKFLNHKDEVILEKTDVYGSKIEYPNDPLVEETAEFKYEFIGWDYEEEILTKDIIIKPIYEKNIKQYTYKFVDDEGNVLKEETVDYGTIPVAPENVTKDANGHITYEFIGWDQEISAIVDNIVYVANFKEVKPTLEGKKVSILGDSISTFYQEGSPVNSYYSGTNTFYYPIYSSTIKTVDLTWWYKLIYNNKMELGINNSWSGSSAYGSGNSAGQSNARMNTITENGVPDIVIIYLGTNDLVNGHTVANFTSAIKTMVNKARSLGAKDIFLMTLGYTAYTGYYYEEENRLLYNESLRQIAKENNCGIIALDEYIVDDNYMIYLGDRLHYNAKGAQLISEICEKYIKEYYGIPFDKEIEVEHKEQLPEGIIGKITATANSDFWDKYESEVFLAKTPFDNPLYSIRIQISKKEDGQYYVSNIAKSGESTTYNCDYVLIISDGHADNANLKESVSEVVIGSIVEFDPTLSFPVEVTFKKGSENIPDIPEKPNDKVEGQLHIGAYNSGVWTDYDKTSIAYSFDAMDKTSTFINFYLIQLTKKNDSDSYEITGLKTVDENATFTSCDYFILIYRELDDKTYFENAKIGGEVIIHGDITSANANLEFK